MSALETMSARQWAQAMGLTLLVAVAMILTVAVVLPTAALILTLALLAAGAGLVARRVGRVASAARRAVAPEAPGEARPTLRLELPGGEVVSARPVPLAHESAETLLLTRDGYVVVSSEGRVLHRL